MEFAPGGKTVSARASSTAGAAAGVIPAGRQSIRLARDHIPRERLFRHPVVGDLHLEQHRLTPSDHPDLNLVVYTPVLTTEAPARLRKMVDTASVAEGAGGNQDCEG